VHNHHHQSGSTGKTQQGKDGAHHTIYNERERARVTGRWQREGDDAFPVALHALPYAAQAGMIRRTHPAFPPVAAGFIVPWRYVSA
jgi:hypothetical protein